MRRVEGDKDAVSCVEYISMSMCFFEFSGVAGLESWRGRRYLFADCILHWCR